MLNGWGPSKIKIVDSSVCCNSNTLLINENMWYNKLCLIFTPMGWQHLKKDRHTERYFISPNINPLIRRRSLLRLRVWQKYISLFQLNTNKFYIIHWLINARRVTFGQPSQPPFQIHYLKQCIATFPIFGFVKELLDWDGLIYFNGCRPTVIDQQPKQPLNHCSRDH